MPERTIMCFGDSNTHGSMPMADRMDRGRYDRQTRWPGQMAAALGAGWHVIEEGNPGRTTVLDDPIEGPHRSGLRVLPSLLESHRPLDVVAVMLGTNDLQLRYSMTSRDIGLAVDRLWRVIAASECGPEGGAPDVIIVSPVPVREVGPFHEGFVGGAEKSRRLAAALEEVARTRGAGFVDAGAVAEVDPVEGVHLPAEAHAAIGAAVAAEVRKRHG